MVWYLATSRRLGGQTSVCMSRRFLEKRVPRLVRKYPHISCSPISHYLVHNSVPLFTILSQMNPVYSYPSYCFKVLLNTTPRQTHKSSKCLLNLCSWPNQDSACITHHTTCATYPAHLTVRNFINRIIFVEDYKSCSSSLYDLSVFCYLHTLRLKHLDQQPLTKRTVSAHVLPLMWRTGFTPV